MRVVASASTQIFIGLDRAGISATEGLRDEVICDPLHDRTAELHSSVLFPHDENGTVFLSACIGPLGGLYHGDRTWVRVFIQY